MKSEVAGAEEHFQSRGESVFIKKDAYLRHVNSFENVAEKVIGRFIISVFLIFLFLLLFFFVKTMWIGVNKLTRF